MMGLCLKEIPSVNKLISILHWNKWLSGVREIISKGLWYAKVCCDVMLMGVNMQSLLHGPLIYYLFYLLFIS